MKTEHTTQRNLWALAGIHFAGDLYSGFLAAILPLIMKNLSLSLTWATFLLSLSSMVQSLFQPVFGYLSDRMEKKALIFWGPAIAATFWSLLGLAPSLAILIALIGLGSLGNAAFHPQMAALSSQESHEKRGFYFALVIAGGSIGYALGPAFITSIVQGIGLEWSWITAPPGFILVVISWWISRFQSNRSELKSSIGRESKTAEVMNIRVIAFLFGIEVVLSLVNTGLVGFLSVKLNREGYSLLGGGMALTLLSLAGTVGGIIGGYLSDRFGRRFFIPLVLGLSVPLMLGFLRFSGSVSLLFLLMGSTFMRAVQPALVITAQEMLPGNIAMVSSLMMGMAWGVSALLLIPVGLLGD
ncbi:MAG: MFS transporter, partial [Candidatus Tectomicrobia bacterium]|nr:MFS transporter [Candidatus Tectomicrobia bacterium]